MDIWQWSGNFHKRSSRFCDDLLNVVHFPSCVIELDAQAYRPFYQIYSCPFQSECETLAFFLPMSSVVSDFAGAKDRLLSSVSRFFSESSLLSFSTVLVSVIMSKVITTDCKSFALDRGLHQCWMNFIGDTLEGAAVSSREGVVNGTVISVPGNADIIIDNYYLKYYCYYYY